MRLASTLIPEPVPLASPRWESGVASLDTALNGGFALGRMHEVYGGEEADAAAAIGFGAAVATGMAGGRRTKLWLRTRRADQATGVLQATGWAELGGPIGHGMVGVLPDAMALLKTAVDALRCAELGAVIVEGWGALRELDLTASRRLALAAQKSGVPLFLLRLDATPLPSAAHTRWEVAAAPSRALPGNAPGRPTFDITLLRQRSGPCGQSWRVEWDRDRCKFQDLALSGAVVPVPVHRPAAQAGGGSAFPDGRGTGGRRAA